MKYMHSEWQHRLRHWLETLKKDLYLLSPFITVPQTSIFSKVGNLLHVDLLVWSGFFFVLTLLPVIYLAGGRKEGKIRR